MCRIHLSFGLFRTPMRKPQKDQIYRHYKGGLYQVEGIVSHSEDLSEMVLYRSLKEPDRLWVRPLSMWFEEVPGKAAERFTLQN